MRVVFDGNIFISTQVFPGSQAGQAFSRILEGTDTLLLSKTILDEVLGILARKFSRDPEALSQTAVLMADMAGFVKPARMMDVFKDDP